MIVGKWHSASVWTYFLLFWKFLYAKPVQSFVRLVRLWLQSFKPVFKFRVMSYCQKSSSPPPHLRRKTGAICHEGHAVRCRIRQTCPLGDASNMSSPGNKSIKVCRPRRSKTCCHRLTNSQSDEETGSGKGGMDHQGRA